MLEPTNVLQQPSAQPQKQLTSHKSLIPPSMVPIHEEKAEEDIDDEASDLQTPKVKTFSNKTNKYNQSNLQ